MCAKLKFETLNVIGSNYLILFITYGSLDAPATPLPQGIPGLRTRLKLNNHRKLNLICTQFVGTANIFLTKFGTNFQNLMGPSEGIVLVWVSVRGGETWADELSYKPVRNTNSHQSLAVMEGTQKVDAKS